MDPPNVMTRTPTVRAPPPVTSFIPIQSPQRSPIARRRNFKQIGRAGKFSGFNRSDRFVVRDTVEGCLLVVSSEESKRNLLQSDMVRFDDILLS
mmetsp:Transcript_23667/g.47053  ORF Transcript_23667/g.47053 Transcript_23667/m.47053 type:complete len:94 (-) Transcript_23667:299-580(-)